MLVQIAMYIHRIKRMHFVNMSYYQTQIFDRIYLFTKRSIKPKLEAHFSYKTHNVYGECEYQRDIVRVEMSLSWNFRHKFIV